MHPRVLSWARSGVVAIFKLVTSWQVLPGFESRYRARFSQASIASRFENPMLPGSNPREPVSQKVDLTLTLTLISRRLLLTLISNPDANPTPVQLYRVPTLRKNIQNSPNPNPNPNCISRSRFHSDIERRLSTVSLSDNRVHTPMGLGLRMQV